MYGVLRLVCPRAFILGRATARIGPDQMVTPEKKPSRDDTQEQLSFVQEECNRLREENARLRTMLGIQESVAAETDSASNAEVSAADSSKSGRDFSTPEGKIALFLNPSSWAGGRLRCSVGGEGGKIRLFARSHAGLASDQCGSARGSSTCRTQDTYAASFDMRGDPET